MRIKLSTFLDNVIKHYKLKDKTNNRGSIYATFVKGVHELLQAGITAQQLLEERLTKYGYIQNNTSVPFLSLGSGRWI